MEKLFGTDGVRGVANTELTPELAMQIGKAGAFALAGHLGRQPKILIGTDTRVSADMLEAALVAGLCSVGAEIYKAGVIPSPAMAFLVRKYAMDAGVMLSASHNPMPDNGIKFFNNAGYKLSDEVEEEIEKLVTENMQNIPRPVGKEVGRSFFCKNAVQDYVDFLATTTTSNFAGLTVALDCANGATYQAAPLLFEKLGAKISVLHNEPTGFNINVNCGSTHLASLQDYVRQNGLDIGLAFDGDGDRVLCVDDTGAELDGDAIMAICGLAMSQKGQLKNGTIVATVMSNLGLEQFCQKNQLNLVRAQVGDRYVIQEMLQNGYNLGGEQSGHIIFGDYNTTGDGILTGLQILAMLKTSGQKLSELRKIMSVMPQVLLSAKLKKRTKVDISQNKNISAAIDDISQKLANKGRILVRASGTEPIIRVMLEGDNELQIQEYAEKLVGVIESELG
ncbi:MAG: phosphoglucosamine mutase [Defluviitaleaceae bacterium]|nr:phosphoglucosamine mutase [Defluviitaleaceae bacterium]